MKRRDFITKAGVAAGAGVVEHHHFQLQLWLQKKLNLTLLLLGEEIFQV